MRLQCLEGMVLFVFVCASNPYCMTSPDFQVICDGWMGREMGGLYYSMYEDRNLIDDEMLAVLLLQMPELGNSRGNPESKNTAL
ncbi:hypothetical protein J3E69DRAFT_110624 [Trichoderma sp. SZMC 28015]